MGAFSFREDIKKVQWGRTLGLNLLRAAAAGIVWGIVMLFATAGARAEGPPWFAIPILLPVAYLVMLPCWFIAAKIVTLFGGGLGEMGVGLGSIFFGLGLAVGDPLVFTLHKVKPALVPTEKFNFINLALVLFVLDPQKI